MNKKLTGKEIAQIAGVSPTTVSLVKKGKSGVSEEKRKEILQLLKESGYAGLPDEKNMEKTIALLIRDDLYDLRHIFYHEVMGSILRICRNQPFNIVVQYIDYENDEHNAGSSEQAAEQLEQLQKRKTRGTCKVTCFYEFDPGKVGSSNG